MRLLRRCFGTLAALLLLASAAWAESRPYVVIVGVNDYADKVIKPRAHAEDDAKALYDLLVDHRGLVVTLWASDALDEDELAEAGIAEVERALAVLGRIGAEGMDLRGVPSSDPDLVAHSTVAMVEAMAAFRSTFFGARKPSRDAIVDELTQAVLHGFLHRTP